MLQGVYTVLQSGGPGKVGDRAKRFDPVVLHQRLRELGANYH